VELRQLEYVLAVAEELHFGRAAERMHVRQQSVSEQVRRLERELGAPLFARTSRRVALTEVGEAFLPEARRVVHAARRAAQVGRRAATAGGGQVRVGYAEDLDPGLFAQVAERLGARVPPVTLVPEAMSSPAQLDAVTEQRLDVGWGWQPEVGSPLRSVVVAAEPVLVVLRSSDPLAPGDSVDAAALSGRPLAMLPRPLNPWLHDYFVAGLTVRGARVRVTHGAARLERLLPLVLSGLAVGITQARAVANRAATEDVVYRPLSGEPFLVEHRLVWRDGPEPPVGAFLDAVEALRGAGRLFG
jgi:DNA-binding transcriptional LysR family regulator